MSDAKSYGVIDPVTSWSIGRIVLKQDGWFFISHVGGRGNSRKPRAVAHEAIPRWARKMGAKLV